jgi:hypothetical protein
MAREEASTRFPFINLEKALARAEVIFSGDKSGRPMAVMTAFQLWGYSPKSSGGFQTVAALLGYGLLQDDGANDDRRVRLTDAARRYFLDERDDVKAGMLRDFALTPTLFKVLWSTDKWSEGVPADTVARSHLKVERKLNEQSARAVLGIFKENIIFAGLRGSDSAEPQAPPDTPTAKDTRPQPDVGREPDAPPSQVDETPPRMQSWVVGTHGNRIDARIVGDRVFVTADVDSAGLRKLKRLVDKYLEILMMEEEGDE